MDSSKIIKILNFVCLLLLAAFFIEASQPALPTTIIGKAVYTNGTVLSGIEVSASWVGNDGVGRVSTAHTLSFDEALALGTPQYAGYYFFNQGYVQASPQSKITLSAASAMNSVELDSSPGGTSLTAGDILFSDPKDKKPPLISDVKIFETDTVTISFVTSEVAIGSVRYGINSPRTLAENFTISTDHVVKLYNLLPFSEYVFEVNAIDPVGNSIIDDNNGNYYKFKTGSSVSGIPSVSNGSRTTSNQNSDPNSNPPLSSIPAGLPSSIYGKVTDQGGDPVENAEVVAKWADADGTHELSTVTLTKEEAAKLGNTDLAGYYFFRKNLTLPGGTSVNISSPEVKEYQASASSVPGSRTEAVSRRVTDFATAPDEKIPEKQRLVSSPIPEEKTISAPKFLPSKSFFKGLGVILSYILILVLSVFAIVSFRHFIVKMKSGVNSKEKELAGVISRDLFEKKIVKFMNRNPVTIGSNEQIKECLAMMVKKEANSIVLMQDKPIGFATAKSITDDVYLNKKELTLQMKNFTIKPLIIVFPSTTLYEAYETLFNSDSSIAVVMDKKEMIGTLTLADISREITSFAKKHSIESESIPDCRAIMEKDFARVNRAFSLKKVKETLNAEPSECVLIDDGSFSIITEYDLLCELYTNGTAALQEPASASAKPRMKTINDSASVFEANEIMCSAGFRRLAVNSQGKNIGIVTREKVVSSIIDYLSMVCDALKKK